MEHPTIGTFQYKVLQILYGHNPAFQILIHHNPSAAYLLVFLVLQSLIAFQAPTGHPQRDRLEQAAAATWQQYNSIPGRRRLRDLHTFLAQGPLPETFGPFFREAFQSALAALINSSAHSLE